MKTSFRHLSVRTSNPYLIFFLFGLMLAGYSAISQCQPVFVNPGEDITLSCGSVLPDFSTCEASSECCDGPVTVTTFLSETGQVVDDCTITTAFGPGPDWAVWLPMLDAPSVSWHFVNQGHLQVYADGTGHLWGVIRNAADASLEMEIELWFQNGRNWEDWSALGRSYKNDLGYAGTNYQDWMYYELVPDFAVIHGLGSLAGSHLNLHHQPADFFYGFQMGMGANNRNGNNGFSGWFTYDGVYNGETVEGHGDVNVDQACDEIDTGCGSTAITQVCRAEDACGNVAFHSQTVAIEDNEAPILNPYEEAITVPCADLLNTFISATDACSEVSVTYTDEVITEGCGGQRIRHYQISDACGNIVLADQVINLLSEGEPEFTVFPEDIEIECSEIDNLNDPQVEWTATCTGTEVTVSEEIVPGSCPGNYTLLYTYALTDACGNLVTRLWTVEVHDTTAPVIYDVPADEEISCGQEIPPALPFALDNCDTDVTISLEAFTEELECGYNFIRTWTATDDCGNTSTATQTIYVFDDLDPLFTFLPPSVTVSCDEGFELDLALVEDQCSSIELTWTDVPLGDCAGSYLRLWRAFDGCGNQALESTTVTLVDETAPVMTSFPEDITAACGQIPQVDENIIQYEDNCGAVSVDYSEVVGDGDCASGYTIVRTWTLTDDCGNSSEWIWTITVLDNEGPSILGVPEDAVINCGDEIPEAVVTAIDNCDENVSVALSATTEEGDCGEIFTRTWTASDACGNVSTASQVITLLDNEEPVFTFVPESLEIVCGQGISLSDLPLAIAEDDCSNLSVSFVDIPQGEGCGNGILRVFTATDGCGNTASAEQLITLIDTEAPVFTFVPEAQTIGCNGGDQGESLQAEATDNCSDVVISFEDEFSGSGCSGGIIRHWIATDACGNQAVADQILSINDNEAPYFTSFPQDMTSSCNGVPDLESSGVEYTDDCGNLQVDVEEVITQGVCAMSYTIERTWTITDACGNSASQTWTIYVVDEEEPQIIGVPANITLNCGDEIPEAVVSAIDNCSSPENIQIALSAQTEPTDCGYVFIRIWTVTDECGNTNIATQEITVVDNEAPYFTFIPASIEGSCGDNPALEDALAADDCSEVTVTTEVIPGDGCGSYTRVFTATDGCGNSVSAQQVVNVVDLIPPVADQVPPASLFFDCSEFFEVTADYVTFTDGCSEVTVEFEEIMLPSDCDGSYTMVYNWYASDACGNLDVESMEVFYIDQTAPVILSGPADLTLSCGELIPEAEIIYSDDCSEVNVYYTDEELSSECGSLTVRTYIAEDACGNFSEYTQFISFEDTEGPAFSGLPEDLFISCDEALPAPQDVIAIDECSVSVEVTSADVELPGNCPNSWIVERTYTAVDGCGNTSSYVQTIYFNDETAPVFDPFEEVISLSCTASAGVFVSAQDNCGNTVITYSDELINPGCNGSLLRTYSATDDCGNNSTAQQIIQLTDEFAPEFVSFPDNVSVDCSNVPGIDDAVVEYTDDCSAVQVDIDEVITNGLCPNAYTIERTWTISDACGNSDSRTWIIQVSDNEAPEILNVPPDMTIDCTEDIPAVAVFAFDNCTAEPVISLQATQETIGCTTYFSRRWTAEDECGNQSIAIQIITITDFYNPVLSDYPADLVLNCGDAIPEPEAITATDNCDSDVSVEFIETNLGDGPCPTLLRTWCATDCTGNEECHTQTISFNNSNAGLALLKAWQSSESEATIRATAACDGRWGIDIYDLHGRLVTSLFAGDMSKGENRQFRLDVSSWNASVYFVRFTNGESEFASGFTIVK